MHISGLFQGVTIKDLKPPKRSDIVKRFVDALNNDIDKDNEQERKIAYAQHRQPKLRPHVKASFIAFKMSHLKVDDLWYFLGYCREAKHFSRTWWWSLKGVEKSLDNSKKVI